MPKLTHNSYGKSNVRLTKLMRDGARHDLLELSVDIQLEGDFAATYLAGDNSQVVATDSIKNTVYVLAREYDFAAIEPFALLLARHFVAEYPQVTLAAAAIEQTLWLRVAGEQGEHPHAFVGGSSEVRTCEAHFGRDPDDVTITSGIADLSVLKTTGSEFHTFVTDRFRTLPDAHDRIFATNIEAEWHCDHEEGDDEFCDWNGNYDRTRRAIIDVFANQHSLSAQQTLYSMGQAALAATPTMTWIHLRMPNEHRIPFNLQPFGLDNPNQIFVPTSEPFGLIEGIVQRGDA